MDAQLGMAVRVSACGGRVLYIGGSCRTSKFVSFFITTHPSEFSCFLAPARPTFTIGPRKEVEVWTAAVLLAAGKKRIRLARMLAPWSEDQFTDVLALTPAIAATSEQHQFGLGARG